MLRKEKPFDFLEYLALGENGSPHPPGERIPPLQILSEEKGVSISVLREQLRVARALGLVEVRPRTGIKRLPYSFAPAVQESLFYAIARDRKRFDKFADLRKQLERSYWHSAVATLENEDIQLLEQYVDQAQEKLNGNPIQLPYAEHKDFHMQIFRHLDNPFVTGILEAYWEAYDEVGLSRYEDLDYLVKVWEHHLKIVEAIKAGDAESSFKILNEHFELINQRPD
jgi:DNA-binding FadR family transcriptional regulator